MNAVRTLVRTIGNQGILAALLAGGALLFPGAASSQEAAFFRDLSGAVEIKAPGSSEWVKAAAGDRIEKQTIISTGFRSSALVVIGESLITVRPVTRLSLEEIMSNQQDEQIRISLQAGRIRAEVQPPSGGKTSFTIQSGVVTASVRGTAFEFDTERLWVDEGRVAYSLASGGETLVPPGGMSYVDEINHTLISPFAAATELLEPAPPAGSSSGSPQGDHAPVITAPPGASVGLGFTWD
jgi:hypothetical protein